MFEITQQECKHVGGQGQCELVVTLDHPKNSMILRNKTMGECESLQAQINEGHFSSRYATAIHTGYQIHYDLTELT